MDIEQLLLEDDPEASAKAAGLHYVTDREPGIRRKRWGRGFTYLDLEGEHITDPDRRERFDALAIPPAWTDVWICPDQKGHMQVTGRDDAGRKVYIYHPRWEEIRSEKKFNRLLIFAEALPTLRAQIDSDLRKHGAPRERVLAAIVRLLDETLIRVGNPEYARKNDSYGLTTLRNYHLDLSGTKLHFEFRGKSGKMQEVDVRDPRVARVVKQLQQLPGQELFQYVDEEGERKTVESGDVNDYLRQAMDEDFTAKEFRTWGGTVWAVHALRAMGPPESEKDAKQKVVDLYKIVSEKLGNTPAVCREYYVHPAVVRLYEEGTFFDLVAAAEEKAPFDEWLEPAEQVTLFLLREELLKLAA